MTEIKLFEVTLKYFICADSKERAEEEMLRISGSDYTLMELNEILVGLIINHPFVIDEEDIPF